MLLLLLLLLIFKEPNAPLSEVVDDDLLLLLLVIAVEELMRIESRFLNMLLNRSLILPLLPRLTLLRNLPDDDDGDDDVGCDSWVFVDADGEGTASEMLLAYTMIGTSTVMVSVVV